MFPKSDKIHDERYGTGLPSSSNQMAELLEITLMSTAQSTVLSDGCHALFRQPGNRSASRGLKSAVLSSYLVSLMNDCEIALHCFDALSPLVQLVSKSLRSASQLGFWGLGFLLTYFEFSVYIGNPFGCIQMSQ